MYVWRVFWRAYGDTSTSDVRNSRSYPNRMCLKRTVVTSQRNAHIDTASRDAGEDALPALPRNGLEHVRGRLHGQRKARLRLQRIRLLPHPLQEHLARGALASRVEDARLVRITPRRETFASLRVFFLFFFCLRSSSLR